MPSTVLTMSGYKLICMTDGQLVLLVSSGNVGNFSEF